MGLLMDRSSGNAENMPPGEKLRFKITGAVEDWGQHGPQAKLTLEVLDDGPYKGQVIFEWASLAQPRTDFVKALRGKGYEDEKIAQILTERGFEFDDIDEHEQEIGVASGGKLFNIAMAAFNGQIKYIDSLETVENLLEALPGRSFVSITKDRGQDGKYTGITWDQVYTDPDAGTEIPVSSRS